MVWLHSRRPSSHREKKNQRARSQLRGSGGISPRFPNIPLRAIIIDTQPPQTSRPHHQQNYR
jgi:hypothetical protein